MSSKYKVREDGIPHFVTFAVVGWVDVFSREGYKEIILDSLRFCIAEKGLILHAWIIMTNHVHLIVSSKENKLPHIIRDFKKYTGRQILHAIDINALESRKEWMLNLFAFAGRSNVNNKEFQFWRQDYHPIILDTPENVDKGWTIFHDNPVRSGLVWKAWNYKYSSAIDYCTTEKGLLEIDRIK